MAQNARVEDLRRRLEREPGSRLFAQLAEELRKEGDLAEAIQVCREGLEKQPSYPSARMTLGRALMDTGDLAAARIEFETVLKGAPDNILASRFLGECLEGLGEIPAAVKRYRATLALAPGDKNLASKIETLEAQARQPPPEAKAPIPLVEVEENFELDRDHGGVEEAAPATEGDAAQAEAPIPVSVVDEPFEVEHSERPMVQPAAPPPPARMEALDRTLPPDRFDLPGVESVFEPEAVFEPEIEEPTAVPVSAEPQPAPAEPQPAAAAEPALNTATLAELYFNQGFTEKAIEVYREILRREPGNKRLAARLTEIEALDRHLRGVETPVSVPAVADPRQARREALERTIERLESFLAVVKRA